VERCKVGVAFLDGKGAEGKAKGDVVDGVRFICIRHGRARYRDLDLRRHRLWYETDDELPWTLNAGQVGGWVEG